MQKLKVEVNQERLNEFKELFSAVCDEISRNQFEETGRGQSLAETKFLALLAMLSNSFRITETK